MSATELTRPPAPPPGPPPRTTWSLLRPLVLRLHFYAGLFISPFLLLAAISGTLYAATPQLEQVVYDHQLHVSPSATALPLEEQIQAALAVHDAADLVAVRPAPTPSDTTRVLFSDPGLGESERTAVFVDPGTGEVRGELTVYGTSGVLPLRTWIDGLHRNLHLGEPGRLYSELAASWLWVIALSGLALWVARRVGRAGTARRNPLGAVVLPERGLRGRARTRGLHGVLGTWLLLGLLVLSATGLTWSTYAGAHVDSLRSALSWTTPGVDTAMADHGAATGRSMEHMEHMDMPGMDMSGMDMSGMDMSATAAPVTPQAFTAALAAARAADLTAAKIEVKAPADSSSTWQVDEIDRGWPTRVDSAAVTVTDDGTATPTAEVVDVVRFADYPFMAKMARWGIDAHTGTLFGLVNQIALLLLGLGLTVVIVLGYLMWWRRRPDPARRLAVGRGIPGGGWRQLPVPVLVTAVAVTVAVGWALPLLGISLVVFLVVDGLRGALAHGRDLA